jgi:hypothetical protein
MPEQNESILDDFMQERSASVGLNSQNGSPFHFSTAFTLLQTNRIPILAGDQRGDNKSPVPMFGAADRDRLFDLSCSVRAWAEPKD